VSDATTTEPETTTEEEEETQALLAQQARAGSTLEKIDFLLSHIGRVAKDGKGPDAQGGYKYLPTDNIVEALRPHLMRIGLVLIQHAVEIQREVLVAEQPVTAGQGADSANAKWSGKAPKFQTIVYVHVTWRLTNFMAKDDFVQVESWGEGTDSQDKALNKAYRGAQKNMWIQLLNIETGEPDAEAYDDERAAPAEPKKDRAAQAQSRAEGAADRPAGKPAGRAPTVAPTPAAEGEGAPPEQEELPLDAAKVALRAAMGKMGLKSSQVAVISQKLLGKSTADAMKSAADCKKLTKEILEGDLTDYDI
jgi:hypothetical protein